MGCECFGFLSAINIFLSINKETKLSAISLPVGSLWGCSCISLSSSSCHLVPGSKEGISFIVCGQPVKLWDAAV